MCLDNISVGVSVAAPEFIVQDEVPQSDGSDSLLILGLALALLGDVKLDSFI